MLVKTKAGLISVGKVEAIVEQRIEFNGDKYRLAAVAKDNSVVNGLIFREDKKNEGMFPVLNGAGFFIGNLKTEVAHQFMETLGTTGYLDISTLDIQEKKIYPKEYTLDGGQSKPYITDAQYILSTGMGMGMGMGMYDVFGNRVDTRLLNEEDYEEESGDYVEDGEEEEE